MRWGSFLMGFGTALLIIAALGYASYLYYQPVIVEYKTNVESIYRVTQSQQYYEVMAAMDSIKPYAEKIAGWLSKISWIIPQAQEVAEYLTYVPRAADFMIQLKDLVEIAQQTVKTLETVPVYLTLMAMAGAIIITIGVFLEKRGTTPDENRFNNP